MIFVYLDEFGHIGPYYRRDHDRYNTSPVFGLAGLLLPEQSVRPFASYFLKQKAFLLSKEIDASGTHGYEWEKKGTNLFTARSITKYPEIKQTAFRIINQVKSSQGRVFYYGREKVRDRDDLNSTGLYKTIFAHAIRQIDSYCASIKSPFVVVVDEHSARKELLETAAKTMYGVEPARWLSSPPFEVESYLNQNIQAADWMASLVGRLWNFKLAPNEFGEYEPYTRYFWDRLHAAATHSTVMERPKRASKARDALPDSGAPLVETITTVTIEKKITVIE